MYIKMLFKREAWNVPGCSSGCCDVLFGAPKIVDVLPADISADCYCPVRSQFAAKSPDVFCYYLDCGAMKKPDIKKAIKLLASHYKFDADQLPAVLVGSAPVENEIILNMKIALANILRAQSEHQPYLSENNMTQVDDVVKTLSR